MPADSFAPMPGHPLSLPPNHFYPPNAASYYGYPPAGCQHPNTQYGHQDGHPGQVLQHSADEYREPDRQKLSSDINQRQLSSLDIVLTMDRLSDLNGSEGTDRIRTFFKKFSSATEDWPDKKRLSALESKLSGRAERAFNFAVNNHPYRFDNIRRAMMEQLEATDCREMGAFDELMSGVRRRNNEDLDVLADRVSSLVRRAYPGLTQNLYDEYSIKHLIRTLANPELSLTLEMSRHPGMSYDDFVALAARAEAVQKATRGSAPGFRNFVQGGIVCYNCDESGHLSRNCPKRWNGAPASQNSGLMPSDAINTLVRNGNSGPPVKFGQVLQEDAVTDAFVAGFN